MTSKKLLTFKLNIAKIDYNFSMIFIVGLGNPGKKYENNRHNVGFRFVDYINKQIKNDPFDKTQGHPERSRTDEKFKVVKTNVFMNNSGAAALKLLSVYKIKVENLIVVHDDLDIPLGKFHIQFGVGPQLHNGLESIENHLKTKDFWRVRIGVDARDQNRWIHGETYVLKNFLPEEKKSLNEEIFPKIFSQLKLNFKML